MEFGFNPAPKPRRRRLKPTTKMRGRITPEVYNAALERSQGLCERCGKSGYLEAAHLIRRWPEVEKLLEKRISADLIIEVMKEKHAKKIKEGGSVKSFSFYIDAINERYNQIEQEENRLGFIDDL